MKYRMKRIWLVEQNTIGLGDGNLTEAMVVAQDAKAALSAVRALAKEFGLVARSQWLRAVDFGPAPDPLPDVIPHIEHKGAVVLVYGTGEDAA